MHLKRFGWPIRRSVFRAWRAATVRLPGGRIESFGDGADQIQAIVAINLDRQPGRWRNLQRELARFRTSDGVPLTSITQRLSAVDARDGRAVAATHDVDRTYRIGDQLYVQPDQRLSECFHADEPVRMTRQEVAVARSHIEAWKAIASGTAEYVLVLEDDVWLLPGAAARIDRGWRAAIGRSKVSEGPALVYLSYADAGGTALREASCENLFHPVRGLWFLSGYVLSKSGAAALLRAMPVVGPVDLWMNYRFGELAALALERPAIAQRRDAESDNSYSILPYLARAGIVDSGAWNASPERSGASKVLAWMGGDDPESLPMALAMLGLRVLVFDGDEEPLDVADLALAMEQFDALVDPPLVPAALDQATNDCAVTVLEKGSRSLLPELAHGAPQQAVALLKDQDAGPAWSPLCEALGVAVPADSYPIGPPRSCRVFRRGSTVWDSIAYLREPLRLPFDESPWVLPSPGASGRAPSPRPLASERGPSIVMASMSAPSPDFPGVVETFPGNLATFTREGFVHAESGLQLVLDVNSGGLRPYRSGAFASAAAFGYGRFEAEIRAARGAGLVTGFFLHRSAPRQEIDVELVGTHPRHMLTNVFFNPGDDGTGMDYGYRGTPIRIDLGFDATKDFHLYGIEWLPDRITWLVDGEVVHQRSGWDPTPIPHLSLKLHGNLWAPRAEEWAGRVDAGAIPAIAGFRNVAVAAPVGESRAVDEASTT